MKVAIPISSGLPSDGGGYTFESEIISTLRQKASDLNHEFWIFNLSQEPNHEVQESKHLKFVNPQNNFSKTLLPWARYNSFSIIRKIYNLKAKFLPISWQEAYFHDFIKSNDFDFSWILSPYALIQSPSPDVPFAISVWDLQHRLQPYFPEVSLKKEWDTREDFYENRLKQATYVITGTSRGKQEIQSFYQVASERIEICPFPTPNFALKHESLSFDKDLFFEKYNLPPVYFFYPAQFWPHKNHFALLNALKILDKKYHINASLVLTGSDKGNAGYITNLIERLGLGNKVHVLGFIPQVDLACLYQFALALVFPSYFGPDNLPPLEAFALGCPVIAADVPGASEQLGEAALLVKPNDVNHIALAMKRVYEDANLRHELSQKGLTRGKVWTTDDYVNKMLSLLDEFEPIRGCWPSSDSISDRSLC